MEKRALRLIADNKLVKLRLEETGVEMVVAYGGKYDRLYLVVPGRYCSCPSFYFSATSGRERSGCVHLRACELAGQSIPENIIKWDYFKNKIFPMLFKGLIS